MQVLLYESKMKALSLYEPFHYMKFIVLFTAFFNKCSHQTFLFIVKYESYIGLCKPNLNTYQAFKHCILTCTNSIYIAQVCNMAKRSTAIIFAAVTSPTPGSNVSTSILLVLMFIGSSSSTGTNSNVRLLCVGCLRRCSDCGSCLDNLAERRSFVCADASRVSR